MIVDSQNKIMKVYLNGIKQKEGSYDKSGIRTSTGNLIFPHFWQLDGSLDDIKIYNRALSDNEIKQQAKTTGF